MTTGDSQRRMPKGNDLERSLLRTATEAAIREYDSEIDEKLRRELPASVLPQVYSVEPGRLLWLANAHKLSCPGNTNPNFACDACRAIDARLMIDIPFDDEHDYRAPAVLKVGRPPDATTTFLAQTLRAWGLSYARIAKILLGPLESAAETIRARLRRNPAK